MRSSNSLTVCVDFESVLLLIYLIDPQKEITVWTAAPVLWYHRVSVSQHVASWNQESNH